jgi:GT2 family glycosyltransferase
MLGFSSINSGRDVPPAPAIRAPNDLISVIIVNWNGRKWLKNCLDSLHRQTHRNLEIILADNASTDGSVPFARELYPDVIPVSTSKNRGYAAGANTAIPRASGGLIMLLNNDTWMHENFVEKLLAFYKSSGCDVVAPVERDYSGFKRSFQMTQIDCLGHPVPLFHHRRKGSDNFYLSGACLLFSKELYLNTRGLDNGFFMYFEEADWFWRLNLLKKKFAYAKDIYLYHFGAASTGKGIKYSSFLWRNQNTLQMLLKNYAPQQLAWILPLYFLQNCVEILAFMLALKPKIAISYVQGWQFNLTNWNGIMKRRAWIQARRKVRDGQIMKNKMYLGPGKIRHLVGYLSLRVKGLKTPGETK